MKLTTFRRIACQNDCSKILEENLAITTIIITIVEEATVETLEVRDKER